MLPCCQCSLMTLQCSQCFHLTGEFHSIASTGFSYGHAHVLFEDELEAFLNLSLVNCILGCGFNCSTANWVLQYLTDDLRLPGPEQ